MAIELGLVTECLAEVSLPEVIRYAAEAGFKTVEVSCVWRGGSWYEGARLVPGKVNGAAAEELEELLASTGVRIACLSYRENLLEGEESARASRWSMLGDVVRAAGKLRVPAVSCYVGRNPSLKAGECLTQWSRLAGDVLKSAEQGGVRVAIENSPMIGWQSEDLPGNVAFAPELWEKLFTHARSEALGLNLDPSHLVWLGVDPQEVIAAYAERIFHVQANDAEVFRDRLSDCSCLRPGGGWWRNRLPGLGEIDWRRFIDRLQEHGYEGPLAVEHEDAVWSGSQERVKRGLEFARRYLERFVV